MYQQIISLIVSHPTATLVVLVILGLYALISAFVINKQGKILKKQEDYLDRIDLFVKDYFGFSETSFGFAINFLIKNYSENKLLRFHDLLTQESIDAFIKKLEDTSKKGLLKVHGVSYDKKIKIYQSLFSWVYNFHGERGTDALISYLILKLDFETISDLIEPENTTGSLLSKDQYRKPYQVILRKKYLKVLEEDLYALKTEYRRTKQEEKEAEKIYNTNPDKPTLPDTVDPPEGLTEGDFPGPNWKRYEKASDIHFSVRMRLEEAERKFNHFRY